MHMGNCRNGVRDGNGAKERREAVHYGVLRRSQLNTRRYKTMLVVDIAPERAHHPVIGAANAFVKAGILNG